MGLHRSFCWLVFGIFLLGNQLGHTQTTLEQTLNRANKHIRDAEQYYAAMKYNKAKESYQFAARLYRNNNLPAYYAICYNGIGNIYIDLTRYEKAKNEGFDKALQQLQAMKTLEPTFELDSGLVADAYEGLGRYYSSIATAVTTKSGPEMRVNYALALEYHRTALAIRQRISPNHPKVALSYYYIGRCYRGFSRDDVPQSLGEDPLELELRYLRRALNLQLKTLGDLHYQTANTYQALGNYFYETQQNYHQGYAYHQAALDIRKQLFDPNHPQIATSYLNLATYYELMNYYDKELEYLEQALQIQLDILGSVHKEVARSYYLLANRYRTNGALEKATGYYHRVLAIYQQLQQGISPEAAATHLALADCYRQNGDAPSEWQELARSQQILEQVLGDTHFGLSPVLLQKGAYYLRQEKYDSTLFFYQKALWINQQQLGKQHYAVAEVYDHLAQYAQLKKQPSEELDYLQQALGIRKQEFERIHQTDQRPHASYLTADNQQLNRSVGQQLHNSYCQLSDYYRRQGIYQDALAYSQWALATVCESIKGQTDDWTKNPSTKDLTTNIDWLGTLERKAHLLLLLYEAAPNTPVYLQTAHATYQQGIEVINQLRTVFQSTKARQELRLLSIPIYEGAIRSLYHLQQLFPKQNYHAEAFRVAELSKSFFLLQGLQHHQAIGSSNIPDSLLQQERALRQRIAYYSNYKNRLASNAQAYDSAYLSTKQQYDLLVQELEDRYPNYYNLKYQTRTVQLKTLQQHLGDQTFLEYFLGDNYLYVFHINADTCYWYEQAIPEHYEKTVYDLRSALTNYGLVTEHPRWAYQSFVQASNHFYQAFVAPFLSQGVKQLTVVPDGMLHYIPFEILLAKMPDPTNQAIGNYQTLDFLLKHYPISYSYSATLWMRNHHQQPLVNNGQCLGMAPSIQFSEHQDSLPWTQKELEAIQETFSGQYFYGNNASKAVFKEQAENYNIIHLATHGIVNMHNPMRSRLSFGPNRLSDEHDEDALYAYEIHNLSLNANLVVLSACETGFGKTVRGEGVLSLSRAFLFAGAPSVVTTLWEVNDFTSAALIELFYTNLAQGMSKPEALRQAKLTFLSKTDEISGHPTYWASFITIGSPRPLQQSAYYNNGWVVILLGFISLILLITTYRLQRSSPRG